MGITDLSDSLNLMRGQSSIFGGGGGSDKIIYLARVTDNSDAKNSGRIKAEIVSFNDKNGQEQSGKDRFDTEAKIAYPLFPQFVNIIPRPDELVYIFIENPKDQSSRRFYVGPIRSQNKPDSEFESTSLSNEIFEELTYNGKSGSEPSAFSSENTANQDIVYIKGKRDADIQLKPREVLVRAGSYESNSSIKNTETTSYIQIKQHPDIFDQNNNVITRKFSQVNIVGSNINLISSDSTSAQNRALDENGNLTQKQNVEINTNGRLNDYGQEAKKLHPLVLGDELVTVLKVLIRFCLNHKHTPQDTAYAPTEEINKLNEFLADENISVILSKSVRTN